MRRIILVLSLLMIIVQPINLSAEETQPNLDLKGKSVNIVRNRIVHRHVVIMVDTSPSMIITPTTLFHHVQHAEEYRQTPASGTFVRWVRFIGIFASIFILPFWYLLSME